MGREQTQEDKELIRFLMSNNNKEWVRRVLEPDKAPPPIKNSDGSISSHRMAAEVDGNGTWFVFPTIVNDGGRLRQFDDNREAMRFNLDRREAISFGKDKDSALSFASGGYKTRRFNQYAEKYSRAAENTKPVSKVQLESPLLRLGK